MADATEDTEPSVPEMAADEPQRTGPRRTLRWASAGILAVGVAAAGYIGWTQVKPTIEARKYANVADTVPEAPKLTARDGETIYRIDPTRSSLTYEIGERFVGKSTSTAVGTTRAIAGDLAVNEDDLAASRIGKIVIDIEQFRSDNNLRDARIRKDFLQSHAHPLATFDLTSIEGLDGPLKEGETVDFTLEGNVTIKDQAAPATFDATATFADGEVTATATTTAKLSRFDAGPISIAGLVSTERRRRAHPRAHRRRPDHHHGRHRGRGRGAGQHRRGPVVRPRGAAHHRGQLRLVPQPGADGVRRRAHGDGG